LAPTTFSAVHEPLAELLLELEKPPRGDEMCDRTVKKTRRKMIRAMPLKSELPLLTLVH
jgi:hypothetical protein